MARLLSGKEVAAALAASCAARAAFLKEKGVTPRLAIVRCGENPSDLSYERGALKKAESCSVETERILLPENVSGEELTGTLERLNADPLVHGVLLFRPLPEQLRNREREICNVLLPEKDVDCMTDLSNAGVYEGREIGFPPCTPEACMKILDYYGIDPKGKNAVVIGRSLVVGRPVAMMLMARHATVTICHTRSVDVPSITADADIIVTSAGAAGSLTKDFVRPGQIVIDVSVNYDPSKNGGKGGFTGDAVFDEVERIAEAITPVPGGVGAVTSTVLMEHVVSAAERGC